VSKRRGLRLFQCIVLVMCGVGRSASACSIVSIVHRVGTHFRVRMVDRGKPVAGVVFHLGHTNKLGAEVSVATTSTTDADGYASFDNVAYGSAILKYASAIDGSEESIGLDVRNSGKREREIVADLFNGDPLVVRSANGVIRDPNYYPKLSEEPLTVTIFETPTMRKLDAVATDEHGRYSFSQALPAGFYVMRLQNSAGENWGRMVIEVRPDARFEEVDGDFSDSSCGLSWKQRQEQHVLQVAQLCGVVTDSEGAEIAEAGVFLLDRSDTRLVRETQADSRGRFDLGPQNSGDYQMVVTRPGFAPFARDLNLAAVDGPACSEPIEVKMDVGGLQF
jgi:Carboxypeptidase regulatory-like domain/Prealbumin-like fold domain